jgi:hypothetical protein
MGELVRDDRAKAVSATSASRSGCSSAVTSLPGAAHGLRRGTSAMRIDSPRMAMRTLTIAR